MWSGTEPLSGSAERKETMRPNVMIVAVEQVLMLVCHFAPPLCLQDDSAAATTRCWDLHYAAINIYRISHPGLNRILLLFVITLMMTFLSDCCSSGWWRRKRLVFLCAQSTRSLSDIPHKYIHLHWQAVRRQNSYYGSRISMTLLFCRHHPTVTACSILILFFFYLTVFSICPPPPNMRVSMKS